MATKKQEMEALEQIKMIVKGLGKNSYLEMAFEGCFEIAEENIQNDWGGSYKQIADSAETKRARAEKELEQAKGDRAAAEERAANLQKQIEQKNQRIDELNAQLIEATNQAVKENNNYRQAAEEAEKKDLEIIKLKARLFDLLEM